MTFIQNKKCFQLRYNFNSNRNIPSNFFPTFAVGCENNHRYSLVICIVNETAEMKCSSIQ